MDKILLCKPKMSGRELDFIKAALSEDWAVPLGPDCDAFEHELERFLGQDKKVAALASGTAAIHLALIACGVKPGDEVIVQSFTFCASVNPVAYIGATPVFVDSEPSTWNIDPDLLEKAIKDRISINGRKPKAIIPVAMYGMPYQIDRIMDISRRYDIPVIEDAAEGFGSRFKGQLLGTFGDYGILSFNGNKLITTSGGGAVICPDEDARQRIMWYATQARESYPYYQHEEIGYNYRLSNISACIGRAQMTVLGDYLAHHRHVQDLYLELFKNSEGITVHTNLDANFDSNFWLCTITIDKELKIRNQEKAYSQIINGAVGGAAGVTHRAISAVTDCQPNINVEALRMNLAEAGIESRPLWKPMHRQPVFSGCPAYVNGISEEIFSKGLCLPAGPWVTDEHVKYIVQTIRNNIEPAIKP